MWHSRRTRTLPDPDSALPGRDHPLEVPSEHFVNGRPMLPPFPETTLSLAVGLGCFWGAERLFWQAEGVWVTAAGYAGGSTPHPTYEEVCTGRTGHTEVVLVVYEPDTIRIDELLAVFWEGHDPTQGMRQGNDVGTQYRSAIYWTADAQRDAAEQTRAGYQERLAGHGYGPITTEIERLGAFYYAEGYHQQYLAKNPSGYCGLGGTGVACPTGLGA